MNDNESVLEFYFESIFPIKPFNYLKIRPNTDIKIFRRFFKHYFGTDAGSQQNH